MSLYSAIEPFLLSFIPLFIAIGALDFLPIVLDLTAGQKEKDRRRLIRDSTLAAAIILVGFLFAGKGVLLLMGVTVADFMVAGGLLLLILSIKALLVETKPERKGASAKGDSIVPLATPLIAGPAAMTTTLILLDSYGMLVTLTSIVLNCAVVWLIFSQAGRLKAWMGERALQGVTKVSYILLASIAVMMVRRGITQLP
jgi:multiple antibiotic resistance protein